MTNCPFYFHFSERKCNSAYVKKKVIFYSHAFKVETLSGIATKVFCLELIHASFSFLQIKEAF